MRRAWDGYQRGRRSKYLLAVRWEELWEMPLAALRADLGIPPARVA
jgi:ubiquinone biosynthesis protein Coq4